MTGATGNLTPDDSDKPLVPAESREIGESPPAPDAEAAPDRETRIGGDDVTDHDEHF